MKISDFAPEVENHFHKELDDLGQVIFSDISAKLPASEVENQMTEEEIETAKAEITRHFIILTNIIKRPTL